MLKLLIIANNANWQSWPAKITALKDYFTPKVLLNIDIIHTAYSAIPFTKFSDGDPKHQSFEMWGVEDKWYNNNVTRIAKGYDIVLFVMPMSQWRVPNLARGWRTDRDQRVVELQVGADENEGVYVGEKLIYRTFEHLAEHEIMHALFMIAGQEDRTHYWDYDRKDLKGALAELRLPAPNITEIYSLMVELLNKAIVLLQELKGNNMNLLDKFCEAIKFKEGFFAPGENPRHPNGTLSWKNNNPGNLRFIGQKLATGKDRLGFCVFRTYEDGYKTLKNMIVNAASGLSKIYSPEMTIFEFFSTYAPKSDGNDPKKYAEDVAKAIGKTVDFKIKDLIK